MSPHQNRTFRHTLDRRFVLDPVERHERLRQDLARAVDVMFHPLGDGPAGADHALSDPPDAGVAVRRRRSRVRRAGSIWYPG